MWMVYPSLTAGIMESHQIFGTTTNIANVRNKAKNQIQPTKIIWEESLNIAKYATNESEGAQQVQITTQLKKLNWRYFKNTPCQINSKIDSGASNHFHEISSTDLPQQPTSNYNPETRVIVLDISSMVSSPTTHLPIPFLPPSATKSHSFNHLESGYLFYVRQSCEHNCTAVFDNNSVKILKSTEVNTTALFPPIIQGHINAP